MTESNYYLEFENNFRGKRQDILDRLSIYDSLIDTIINNSDVENLLDLGCGRGEFLQRVSKKIPNSIGIEFDSNMISLCKENGLNIIEGDVIQSLANYDDESISIITIFHVIEHLNNDDLSQLIKECYRILNKDGVLIIETPSIDSILVSTKQFYIDPTHINHIHPEGLNFLLQHIGFQQSKYFFIHGGPLSNDFPLKITRILNGVAQDLLFVCAKGENMSKLLFTTNIQWEDNIDQAPTTFQTVIDYDLENNKLWSQNHNLLNNNSRNINKISNELKTINSDLENLKYVMKLLKKINYILFKISIIFNLLKKILIRIIKFILRRLLENKIIRKLFSSKKMMHLLIKILENFPFKLSKVILTKLRNKMHKLNKVDLNSLEYNNNLIKHFSNSLNSKTFYKLLKEKTFREKK